jgi:hypothetical protein
MQSLYGKGRTLRASTVVPIAVAMGAAVAVLILNRWIEGEWQWLTFSEDLIRNTFLGGLLAVATTWLTRRESEQVEYISRQLSIIHERDRALQYISVAALAASGWSKLFDESNPSSDQVQVRRVIEGLQAQANELRRLAEKLERVREISDAPFQALNPVIAGTVYAYVLEGARQRRYGYLKFIADRTSSLAEAREGLLVKAVNNFQLAFVFADGLRVHTNTTVMERLLVEREVPDAAIPYRRQDPRRRELLQLVDLHPAATVFEPLYLLMVFGALTDPMPIEPDSRVDVVGRCLGALRNELGGVADALSALAELLLEAERSSDRPLSQDAASPLVLG